MEYDYENEVDDKIDFLMQLLSYRVTDKTSSLIIEISRTIAESRNTIFDLKCKLSPHLEEIKKDYSKLPTERILRSIIDEIIYMETGLKLDIRQGFLENDAFYFYLLALREEPWLGVKETDTKMYSKLDFDSLLLHINNHYNNLIRFYRKMCLQYEKEDEYISLE